MTTFIQSSESLPLEARIEGLLFIASAPITPLQLADALECDVSEVEDALQSLQLKYEDGRGLNLQRHAGKVQMTTSPLLSAEIERFLGLEATSRLSRAALETLAIVAYRQPITRPGIDQIRGVSSDGVLRSLLSKGLVQETGRAESPGRPILYEVTTDFLQYFGLSSVDQLPPFEQDAEAVSRNEILKD
jgi:segregation and condensation protein B